MSEPEIEFKDFTLSNTPKRFKINDDIFEAAPEIPLDMLGKLANFAVKDDVSLQDRVSDFYDFFDGVLFPDSAARFRERGSSRDNPIGINHVQKIVPWLMEAYGMRPTQPSSDSGSGSSDGNTSSTDGVSSEESTSQL